jgi:hypothetical protein
LTASFAISTASPPPLPISMTFFDDLSNWIVTIYQIKRAQRFLIGCNETVDSFGR